MGESSAARGVGKRQQKNTDRKTTSTLRSDDDREQTYDHASMGNSILWQFVGHDSSYKVLNHHPQNTLFRQQHDSSRQQLHSSQRHASRGLTANADAPRSNVHLVPKHDSRNQHPVHPQLSTIDLSKDFVPPDSRPAAAAHRTAAAPSAVLFNVKPPAALASSLVSCTEMSFMSAEAAIAATNARCEYIQKSALLPSFGRQSEHRARPLTVPESSPR